jgi:tetratricopeptide (TPR) repeat protein
VLQSNSTKCGPTLLWHITVFVTAATSVCSDPVAACRYKEAVNECSAALDMQPNFFKALLRRGRAYEQMGLYKQALADLQKANKLDASNSDSKVRSSAGEARVGTEGYKKGGQEGGGGWGP